MFAGPSFSVKTEPYSFAHERSLKENFRRHCCYEIGGTWPHMLTACITLSLESGARFQESELWEDLSAYEDHASQSAE